jgi:DNA-binding GntR family transcriptional regulator
MVQLKSSIKQSELASSSFDFITISEMDYEFHRSIAIATGNRYLSRYLLHLHQVATRFNLASWKRDLNAEFSLKEHYMILEALHNHDEKMVQKVMLEHIENACKRVMGAFQSK